MQEEFRARRLEQEMQQHKTNSMSKQLCDQVHRGADDIATTDVADIKIAMTAKVYAPYDGDIVDDVQDNIENVEEFEMYEKFVLQHAVKNSKLGVSC